MPNVRLCPECREVSDRSAHNYEATEQLCSECVEFFEAKRKEDKAYRREFEAYALELMDQDGWECEPTEQDYG